MSRTVFAVVLALCAVGGTAQADVSIRGVLEAGPQPFAVDSVFMDAGTVQRWFPTAGWSASPMSQDTFNFPPFERWPDMLMISAFVEGQPILQTIPQPERDRWYNLDPPFEQVKVMFQQLSGIEERPACAGRAGLSVQPAVIKDAAVIRAVGTGLVEIFDAAGNVVRSFSAPTESRWNGDDQLGRRLATGIYFCRLTSDAGRAVCRVVLAR